jgi:hypothetical protein
VSHHDKSRQSLPAQTNVSVMRTVDPNVVPYLATNTSVRIDATWNTPLAITSLV